MTIAPIIGYRLARPEDAPDIESLDGSFTTLSVFEATASDTGFLLREVPVDPPLHKVFPPEEHDEQEIGEDTAADRRTFVAVDEADGGRLCGFAAVGYSSWNRRLTIEDIEVAPAYRGIGIGRTLMEHAAGFARERGARHLWLEVSSVNVPAVHAYRRMGFAFCGLDTTLYDGTPAAGEQALYMARPLS
ncbi:N-acetyltransferase [Streptomyces venezuelae]|uniref:N-acetyltransferase n=1 Tax=Streptomyces venezuelae TaxID=54571 RepID=A0A5P2DBL9_STRVZ|nr:GNAT family N-acetyltransferase [Streptomyces venezuelae]QES51498.1 N-acetyltransferase [Streptomyces venezuelae]